jgi:hypothetical protein
VGRIVHARGSGRQKGWEHLASIVPACGGGGPTGREREQDRRNPSERGQDRDDQAAVSRAGNVIGKAALIAGFQKPSIFVENTPISQPIENTGYKYPVSSVMISQD